MAYSCLPTWPLVLFGILEPLALIWAYFVLIMDPLKYFSDQSPSPVDFLVPQAEAMTLQLGNVFLLLAAMAIVCSWTKHSEIAIWYLIAVGFADFGHIYATYRGLPPEYFWDITQWNDMVAGNVGASAFLNVNRWLTVLGVFGKLTNRQADVKKLM